MADDPFKRENNFKREFQSKTAEKMQERLNVIDPAKKINEFKSELQRQDDEKAELAKKEKFEETEIKKKNKGIYGLFQPMLDVFTGRLKERQEEIAKEKKATEEKNKEFIKADRFEGLTIQDIIAPRDMEIDFNDLQIGDKYYRTFFVSGYPRFVGPNWLSPIINFEYSLNISSFYYPVDSKTILEKLKKKIGELEATLYSQMEDRKVVDPSLKVALSDAQQLQDSIAEGVEKFFHFAMYITISSPDKDLLEKISKNVVSTLASINVAAKTATLQQEHGLISTQPLGTDKLYITRNMDTTSLATTFPFVTSELTMDHGVMYGINQHNKSLVIFDRFSLENANAVVFAKSGAGKSYYVKLEAIRSLMLGTEIIIIDPDKEYEPLCKAVEGAYISFSQDKGDKINPFELSGLGDPEDDELRMKILSLQGFLRLLLGDISPVEMSILDRALLLTYREKGITLDPNTQRNKKAPLLEDLYKVLKGMAEPEARAMSSRLERYIIGSAAGIFNEESTVELNNPFMVFSIRDLQEELRPMAMYLMLDFIWTRVRKDLKKRIMIVDEAWYMMQNADSAKFLYSVAKRARKYYLGLTTITQDVEDFLNNDYGKAIISNSSMQFLMKQNPNAADRIQQVFSLSDGEKNFLLSCDKGQGLFFAGSSHVAIQVISSVGEDELITSDPKILDMRRRGLMPTQEKSLEELSSIFEPPAMQNPLRKGVSVGEKKIIEKALDQRKRDMTQILQEKIQFSNPILNQAAQMQNQSQNVNNTNLSSKEGMQQYLQQNSLSEAVSANRKAIQSNSTHLTPQGVIDNSTDNNS